MLNDLKEKGITVYAIVTDSASAYAAAWYGKIYLLFYFSYLI